MKMTVEQWAVLEEKAKAIIRKANPELAKILEQRLQELKGKVYGP